MFRRISIHTALVALLTSLAAGYTQVSVAASFGVYPLKVTMSDNRRTAAMRIKNNSSATPVQSKIFKWDRVNGRDILKPTRDIIVTPPIVTIGQGEQQSIRLRTKGAIKQEDVEQTYRIKIKQLKPNEASSRLGSLIRMEMSIPIFIPPREKIGVLDVGEMRYENGRYHLQLTNSGNLHLKLENISLFEGDNPDNNFDAENKLAHATHTTGGTNYIFPDETAVVAFPPTKKLPKNGKIAITTDYKGFSRKSNLSTNGVIWAPINPHQ